MTPQTAEPPKYITKDIAAAILGIGTRRVLELATDLKKIGFIRVRNPETNMQQTLLLAEDVEKFAKLRQAPPTPQQAAALPQLVHSTPPQLVPSAPPQIVPAAPVPQLAAPTAEAPVISAYDAIPQCAWLTLEQASAYSGLPVAFLAARIRTGALSALDVGGRGVAKWRVKREALDAIDAGLSQGNTPS